MKEKSASVTLKQILKLAAPISLTLLISQISFFANTAFLGRLGVRELAVNSITSVFYLILSMIGYGLANGMQIQMARRAGENDKEGIAQIFSNGIMLALLFAFGLMLITMWFVPFLFGYSLHDFENLSLSVSFIYIRIWGLPFLMLTQLISSFYISVEKARFLIYGAIVATIVNVFFDYSLIFGKFGLPAMGFTGAALASVIAEIFYFLTMAGIFFYKRFAFIFPIFNYVHFDFELSKRTLSVASPLIVQFMFSIGGWLIFFIFIEHLGNQSLAASMLLRNVFGIMGIGLWALATACNTLVSNAIGQNNEKQVLSIIYKISKVSFVFALITCIGILCISRFFLSLYTNDGTLIEFALPSLRVIMLATVIMSVATVVFNGVVGTGNTIINLTMEIACVGLYLVYCYFIIWLWRSPLYLCWGSEFVYWVSLLIASFVYLKSGKWKGKKI